MILDRYPARLALALAVFFSGINSLHAGEWDITSRLTVGEIFSDNVDLEPDNENSALITEVSPSISITGTGGRFRANIDYQMENFFSSRDNFSPNTSHQLNGTTRTEVASNFFFVEAGARAGQALLNVGDSVSRDNYTSNRNRTDFYSYSISPYITPHFGTYADGTLGYGYERTVYSKGDASDATTQRVDASIVNGRRFSLLSWAGNYSYSKESRSGSSPDVTYEQFSGNGRFRLTRYFSLVGQAGYTNDDFETSEDFDNGAYWSVGGFWQHSRFYSVEYTKGRDLETATLGLFPTRRTQLVIDYRDQDVGTNAGKTWSGRLSHYTRRSNWSASYSEDTTTSQQRLVEEQDGFLLIDPITGEPNPNPQPGDLVVAVPLGPTVSLTDEVQERKRGEATVGFKTGKSGLRASVFQEENRFLTSLQEEKTRGVNGSWNWRLAPRTNSILTASWERNTGSRNENDNDYWYIQAVVRRQISTGLSASLSYRFQKQDSDNDESSFEENSIRARLTATF